MVTIEIKNHQKKIPLNPLRITKIIKRILNLLGIKDASLSLVFVTDRKIKELNKKYLAKDSSTDVLAFDYSEGRGEFDGEVVISATTACANASSFNAPVIQELFLYIVHGILHLLGYDDHSEKDIKKMRRKEGQLMLIIADELKKYRLK